MTDILLTAIDYGGYISPVKLAVFLILFFLWLPLVGWVHQDSIEVRTKVVMWTWIVFGAGAVAAIAWLVIPIFIVGLLFYVVVVGASAISYVVHRNSLVMDYEKVLTAEHLGSLFKKKDAKIDTDKGIVFITANKNEVPVPQSKTPDFFGYKTALDLFTDAQWRRAENIVISPSQEDYSMTYFVDGVALKQPSIPKDQMDFCVTFLKNVADLSLEEKRKPQKSKLTIRKEGNYTEWEVITAGSTAGEKVQLNLKTKENVTKLSDLSLMPNQLQQLSTLKEATQGVFIVAGPPKSGVTTTFYAMIRAHDPFIYNVNTLERQPTGELLNVTQNVYSLSNSGTATFADKLQSLIRMGPDIIGVAECQDTETARLCCEAAKSGKIVYVTIHADNVLKAVGKWLKLVGDRTLAGNTLIGVSNQRILRKLCDECKEAYEPNKEMLRKFSIPADKAKVFYRPGKVIYDKHGKPFPCEHCQETGFYGRMCVFETILINDDLQTAVKKCKSLSELNAHFRRAKMLYLQEQALRRVLEGTTSINEMVRIFSPPQNAKPNKTQ